MELYNTNVLLAPAWTVGFHQMNLSFTSLNWLEIVALSETEELLCVLKRSLPEPQLESVATQTSLQANFAFKTFFLSYF